MRGTRELTMALALALSAAMTGAILDSAAAQTKPEGEMRWALYVTVPPAWFDPGEVVGVITPFWVLYAMHDAVVKPMPGNHLTPSLAESWTMSADQKTYEFKLRQGVKFHNGDPFTADDVKFSFHRAKGKILHDKVKDVVVVDPYRVRFVLHEPWPDFMIFYGTFVSGAGWVVPKKYVEQVGVEGFKKHPIGLGPYKFVSYTPGVELVMEAYEGYWRKMPSVKRLVYKSVPEATTRLAMLKRGEVDLAYLIDTAMADEVKRDPNLKLAFSGGIGTDVPRLLRHVGSEVPVGRSPRAPRRQLRHRPQGHQRRRDGRRLSPTGNVVPKSFEFALPLEPTPYDPAKAKQLLAEAGYPNGFDAGDLYPWPPYFSTGEAVTSYLAAVGIKTRVRTMERAAFYSALGHEEAQGALRLRQRRLRQCRVATVGDGAERRRLCLWQLAGRGGPLQAAGAGDRPEEARRAAPPDPADPLRARAVRAHLRLHLAERGRAAGGGPRAHADQSVPVVGAARRGAPQEEVRSEADRQRISRGSGTSGGRRPRRP